MANAKKNVKTVAKIELEANAKKNVEEAHGKRMSGDPTKQCSEIVQRMWG